MTQQDFLSAWARVKRGHDYRSVGEIGIYTLPAFAKQTGISHGFSARTGGVSTGSLASLNLSFNRPGEPRETVMENYRLFCNAAGIPEDSMVMDTYEHGATVLTVDRNDQGKGWTRPSLPPCDGIITNDPSVTLMTGHADCMAFYAYDPIHRAIGLAHAGWRGALGRIGSVMVGEMTRAFGSEPTELMAGVGPSICPNCFEVGGDVAETFADAFPDLPCIILPHSERGKAHVNLWMVAVCQFLEAGLRPERISLSEVCTYEDDRLYSHRRDKGDTGGMTAFLRLK